MGRPGGGYRRWVTVGDDATVGANSLLVHDVPPRSVMLDVPVRVVATRGSFTQVVYRDVDHEDERQVALGDLEAGPERYDSRNKSCPRSPPRHSSPLRCIGTRPPRVLPACWSSSNLPREISRRSTSAMRSGKAEQCQSKSLLSLTRM